MTMNNTLSKIIVFAAGAAVGSVVTWKLVKTKYEKIAQEEIDSVKEAYAAKYCEHGGAPVSSVQEDTEAYGDEEPDFSEEEIEEYERMIDEQGYITESNDTIQNDEKGDEKMNKPYSISPEEFSETDAEIITLHYYANNVIVDEFGGKIDEEDWDEMIGNDFASHFGEYPHDPDTVYIRNEKFGIDYEILKELDDYTEDN